MLREAKQRTVNTTHKAHKGAQVLRGTENASSDGLEMRLEKAFYQTKKELCFLA